MRSLKEVDPRPVGLVVAAVLGAMVVAAFTLSTVSFGDRGYTAEFARSGGIKAGDEVRIAGVGVGKVTSVELAEDHVLVGFKIDGEVDLGEETRAEIKLATLLGNKYLELVPEGDGELADGTIPLAHTHVTFEIQDALETGGDSLGKLDAKAMRQAFAAMTGAFEGTPEEIRATLDGLARVSRVVSTRRDELSDLLEGTTAVVETLRSRSGDIVTLMKHADLLFRELSDRREALHQLIVGTRTMARELSGLIGDNEETFEPLLDAVNDVTAMLNERADAVDRGLRAIAPAARYFANAGGNGPYADVLAPYPTPDNVLCRGGVIEGCN